MPVYVDTLLPCARTIGWRHDEVSHLFADTIKELHAFAKVIGLKRCWYHNKRGRNFPHYDLNREWHQAAVKGGAHLLTREQFVEFKKARMKGGTV